MKKYLIVFSLSILATFIKPLNAETTCLKFVKQFQSGSDTEELAYGRDGTTLAVTLYRGPIYVFDLSQKTERVLNRELPPGGGTLSVGFNAKGQVISSGIGRTLIWSDKSDSKPKFEFKDGDKLVISPDGRTALNYGSDDVLVIDAMKPGYFKWNWRKHLILPYTRFADAAAFSSRGGKVVVASPEDVKVFSTNLNKADKSIPNIPPRANLIGKFRGPEKINSVAFSPDSKRIIIGDRDGIVSIYDAARFRPLSMKQRHRGPVHTVAYSRDGAFRISAGEKDGLIQFVRTSDSKVAYTIDVGGYIRAFQLNPNGKEFAVTVHLPNLDEQLVVIELPEKLWPK